MRRKRNNRGVTLVEVVTSIVVLGIAIPPLIAIFNGVAARSPDQLNQRAALLHAQGLLEEIASKAFEDPDLPPGSFGTEEGFRAAYDDIDDYDGMSNSPPRHFDGTLLDDYAGFKRSVRVGRVTGFNPDPIIAVLIGASDFKRIRVTVSWSGARGGELTVSTLRTRLGPVVVPVFPNLDVPASEATAVEAGKDKFDIDLVSISPGDLVIESFSLSSSLGGEELESLELDSNKIWDDSGVFLPTGTTALNEGSTADRTIPIGTSPPLRVQFVSDQPGTVEYTLVINFTDGSSATLIFRINW